MSASWDVLVGDSVEVLAGLPEASIDAVVCDPPYGLSQEPDVAEVLTHWLAGDDYQHRGGGFMGRSWDSFVPGPAYWCECLRVLKPGGHLLAFGGTRTYDLLVIAVRLAGFEIRDTIAWMYGSGFPKSLDVSKAIDKRRDDEADLREVCRWLRAAIDGSVHDVRSIAEHFGFHPRMVEHWAARDTDSQPTLPTLEQWDALRGLLGLGDEMDAEVLRLNLRKGEPGEAWANRPVTGLVEEWKDRSNYALTSRDGLRRDVPGTPDAARWQGWGTALKPAFEPVVVARKPLARTVAANVLEHGTGALNIDGCRIEAEARRDAGHAIRVAGDRSREEWRTGTGEGPHAQTDLGRWPANVVLDEEAGALLDEQTGEMRDGVAVNRNREPGTMASWLGTRASQVGPDVGYGGSGGASRFFYCAKASTAERNAGLDGFAAKTPTALGRGLRNTVARCPEHDTSLPSGSNVYRCGCAQAYDNGDEDRRTAERPKRNGHPTVKPIDLMRWLVRLVTPPGGTVLDPFLGSGTTGCAAVLEGFDFVGIERDEDYARIAEARIQWWSEQPPGVAIEKALAGNAKRTKVADAGQASLFG